MRRILSISLLLLFMLPLVSPLFAASATDANVPICCRRDGKHHCMMAAIAHSSSSDGSKTQPASLHESCPYNLSAFVAINLPFLPDAIQTAVSAGRVSSSTPLTQTEGFLRISMDRSHQKRGPPSPILSHS